MITGFDVRRRCSIARQRGVALGVVVWFIAGMALLVSGIIAEARIDTRMAQLHYFKAQAAAAGDGAINLALAEQEGMRASGQRGADRVQNYQIGPRSVKVRMIPAGVFVNISTENLRGLRSLFNLAASESQQRGTFWEGSPAALAAAVVEFRDGVGRRKSTPFHSPEDLLRVPGISRSIFEAVRGYITVNDLAGGFQGDAKNVDARLNQLSAAMRGEGSVLKGSAQHSATSLRIDAIVEIGDQQWLRRRWVTLQEGGYSVLPWRFVRTEAARPAVIGG
jgi:general secretion pathway protein K